jgi:ABC-type phosphate transport system permease subunit
MAWKDWPSWLEGGIILSGLYIIINILMLIAGYALGGEGLILFLITSHFPIAFILHNLFNFSTSSTETFLGGSIIYLILNTIIFFLIGALIGLIIGKLRKK